MTEAAGERPVILINPRLKVISALDLLFCVIAIYVWLLKCVSLDQFYFFSSTKLCSIQLFTFWFFIF